MQIDSVLADLAFAILALIGRAICFFNDLALLVLIVNQNSPELEEKERLTLGEGRHKYQVSAKKNMDQRGALCNCRTDGDRDKSMALCRRSTNSILSLST